MLIPYIQNSQFRISEKFSTQQALNPPPARLQPQFSAPSQDAFIKSAQVGFKGEDSDWRFENIAPIDLEALKKCGEKFIKKVEKNSSAKNVRKQLLAYNKNITPLLYPEVGVNGGLKHQVRTWVAASFGLEIDSCGKDLLERTRQVVELANLFAQINQKIYDAKAGGKNIGVKECLYFALEYAERIKGSREIKVGDLSALNKIKRSNHLANYIIFSNLLENAIKYSPPESTIKVGIETKRIEAQSVRHTPFERLYFVVEDEGIGIKPEDQKRVLEQGERGSNVGGISGTGLGLGYVSRAAQQDVEIESPPPGKSKGTRIKARLSNTGLPIKVDESSP